MLQLLPLGQLILLTLPEHSFIGPSDLNALPTHAAHNRRPRYPKSFACAILTHQKHPSARCAVDLWGIETN